MRPLQLLALAFAVIVVIGTGPAIGASGTSLELSQNLATDGFEDSDVKEYTETNNSNGVIRSEASSNAAEGSVAWRLVADATSEPGGTGSSVELATTEQFSIDPNSSFNISFDVDLQTGGSEDENCFIEFQVFDGNGSKLTFENTCRGDQDQEVRLLGPLVNNADGGDGTNLDEGVGYEEVVIVVNRTDSTAKVFVDGSERLSTNLVDDFSEPNNISFLFKNKASGDDTGSGNNVTALWDDIRIEAENFSDLTLDINSFMEHGTTQDYVVRNETADVTDDATVTSSDSDVVSVDEAAKTLSATNDETVNQKITITATVSGRSVSKNVTVANKSLNNIAILPPATWPSALFGQPGGTFGSSSTWPGAVQLQWIFVSLVMGAVASWATRTDIIGIAIAMAMLAFGWVPAIGWVSNGVLVGALLFFIWLFSTGRMEMVRT